MIITFNGQTQALPQSISIAQFLKTQAIEPQTGGIAIAINQKIITRLHWDQTLVKSGDSVEVIMAVQGG